MPITARQLALISLVLAAPRPAAAQSPRLRAANAPGDSATHLVVAVPSAADVVVRRGVRYAPADSPARLFDLYLPHGTTARTPCPVVVFANSGAPSMREWTPYREWARLVTTTGAAAIVYDATGATGLADLRALLAHLRAHGRELGVDPAQLVVWAGSGNAAVGTPVALDTAETGVRAYVLYYGAGTIATPRIDVPVLVARAGLDMPTLDRALDALVARLVAAGAPVRLLTYPGGRHGFDWYDRSEQSRRIIEETLAFIRQEGDTTVQRERAGELVTARAAAALYGERWPEAAALFERLARAHPDDAALQLRLGLARLGAGEHAAALEAFARARAIGGMGARDLGAPAVRASVRAGDREGALGWLRWMLERMPPQALPSLRADAEIAPLLDDPSVSSLVRR